MQVRKYIYLLILSAASLIMWGCGSDSNRFKITGEFSGMKAAELYIYNPYSLTGEIDTIRLKEGEFTYQGEVTEPTPYVLQFPNAMEHIIFVSPGATVEYSAVANDLKNYSVKGSEENKMMTEFRQATANADRKKIKEETATFIRNNAESIVSKYLFDRYLLQSASIDKKEILELIEILKQAHPSDPLLVTSEIKIQQYNELKVGDKLPDLKLTDRNRKTHSIWQDEKTYTLIFLWATWSNNSYDNIWRLRQLANNKEYSEKVKFVGISVDNTMTRWKDITRNDTACIDNSCDGLAWNSPTVRKLGVYDIPTFIIVDKNHKVEVICNDINKAQDEIKNRIKE